MIQYIINKVVETVTILYNVSLILCQYNPKDIYGMRLYMRMISNVFGMCQYSTNIMMTRPIFLIIIIKKNGLLFRMHYFYKHQNIFRKKYTIAN